MLESLFWLLLIFRIQQILFLVRLANFICVNINRVQSRSFFKCKKLIWSNAAISIMCKFKKCFFNISINILIKLSLKICSLLKFDLTPGKLGRYDIAQKSSSVEGNSAMCKLTLRRLRLELPPWSQHPAKFADIRPPKVKVYFFSLSCDLMMVTWSKGDVTLRRERVSHGKSLPYPVWCP